MVYSGSYPTTQASLIAPAGKLYCLLVELSKFVVPVLAATVTPLILAAPLNPVLTASINISVII